MGWSITPTVETLVKPALGSTDLLRHRREIAVLCLTFALAVILQSCALQTGQKTKYGLSQVVNALLSRQDLRSFIFLITSDPIGEGAFVAEVAEREHPPRRIVVRSDKLATNQWRRVPLWATSIDCCSRHITS